MLSCPRISPLAPEEGNMARSTIIINGMTITADARSISVRDGKVHIDGRDVTPDAKEVSISIVGNVERLDVDACSKVSVTGDVGSVKTMSGDVEVGGNVTGNVGTMSGSVRCDGSIGGNVSSMSGDIKSGG